MCTIASFEDKIIENEERATAIQKEIDLLDEEIAGLDREVAKTLADPEARAAYEAFMKELDKERREKLGLDPNEEISEEEMGQMLMEEAAMNRIDGYNEREEELAELKRKNRIANSGFAVV